MRWRSALLVYLPLAALSLGSAATHALAADEPEHPVQFHIKVQNILLNEAASKALSAAVTELRRTGMVVGEAADTLRPAIAAQVASGAARVNGQLTLAVLDGSGGELRETPRAGGAGFAGVFVPRLTDGKVSLDLKLRYGVTQGKVFSGQSFEEKLVLPGNGRLAFRLAPTKESPVERIVQIEVTRVAK